MSLPCKSLPGCTWALPRMALTLTQRSRDPAGGLIRLRPPDFRRVMCEPRAASEVTKASQMLAIFCKRKATNLSGTPSMHSSVSWLHWLAETRSMPSRLAGFPFSQGRVALLSCGPLPASAEGGEFFCVTQPALYRAWPRANGALASLASPAPQVLV